MSVKKFFAAASALSLVLVAASANAATMVNYTLADTTGVAGSKTYTLTATSDAGKIIGFNFDSGGGSGYGLLGPMGQVNPLGLPSVLNDNTEALYTAAGSHISADSHFLVKAADGIAINAAETATSLTGAFNLGNTTNATNSFAFAQVAIAGAGSVQVIGQFTVESPSGNVLESVNSIVPIPEPASFALAGLALVGFGGLRRRMA